jgi:hypothetical protein
MVAPRRILDFFAGPSLPASCRDTYVRHLVYALLDAAAAGILANAPLMALKGMGSPPWQMALQMAISSIGMFFTLYWGGYMANRNKMPFVVGPGLAFVACSVGMAVTCGALPFLVLAGMGALFETLARPAIVAVIREKYPAAHRGAATGRIRTWCSLVFLLSGIASAWSLDRTSATPLQMIRSQMLLAAALSAAGFLVFRTIRLDDVGNGDGSRHAQPIREALRIARTDSRFARYLLIGGLYSLGGMVFASFLHVLFSNRLKCGYLASTIFLHVQPGILAFAATGWIGGRIDRSNPWAAWRWIRLGWGLDPVLLAAAPGLAVFSPSGALALVFIARTFRGLVMGGSWLLWWQVGVCHFARPGADTTRYQGMALFMNGIARLIGPTIGALLLHSASIEVVLLAGGGIVLLSSWLSSRELAKEERHTELSTIEHFERQFENGWCRSSPTEFPAG